ncbi:mspA family protein [Nocardia sp. SYP-A9097]|uniref:MspA family porin n=1 Tax=Nocardia sp. SYP-A9097 TaxID=2663237 RepID=UPI00129A87DF|nr:MspA family porin [Nocardia sp. SYP-A9097]MRH89795.1 mspA family protein [Nocardia sp. SYP-A9097]
MVGYSAKAGIKALSSASSLALCGLLAGTLTAGSAAADTLVPLPDGQHQGAHDVTLIRTGEHAMISPSLAANGAGRVVWMTGTVVAEIPDTPETEPGPHNFPTDNPGTNNSSTHGSSQLSTGYIVGCQVALGEDAVSLGLSGSVNLSSAGIGGALGVQVSPGEVKFVQIDYKDITTPGTYAVEYQDAEIEIQGCGGFAQARAYSVVEIVGDHYSKTTLYGAPFSIG